MLKLKKVAVGLLTGVLCSALALMIVSLAVLKIGQLPGAWAGMLAATIGGVSVFAAAFLTAHLSGEKGLLHGILVAAAYGILYAVLSLALHASVNPVGLTIREVVFLLSGAVAGILGVGKKEKVKF